jgi:type IV pilus assembly protein PilO
MAMNKNFSNRIKADIQSVKNFDFASMEFSEAGNWPLPIKGLFIIIVCTMIIFFGNKFHISNMESSLDVATKKEKTLLEEVTVRSFVDPTIIDYKNQLKQLNQDLQSIASQLPEKIEMSSILDEMTLLANNNNVMVSRIDLEKEEEEENYIELPFVIQAKGKFHNFASFLSELSRMNRIVTVNQLAIAPEPGSTLLNLELIAKTYKYKQVKIEEGENNE